MMRQMTGLVSAVAALALAGGVSARAASLEWDADGAPPADYSPEYVSAWYTLDYAVAALQLARTRADAAAARAGTTLEVAGGGQPDLLHLARELAPYFSASSDEDVHEAYLLVARGDAHLV